MKRGDIVIAAEKGRLTGKPRPWLVVQSDAFNPTHPSLTLCLLSGQVGVQGIFRILVPASAENGLEENSVVMIDKLFTLGRDSIQQTIGALDGDSLRRVEEALRHWLDL